MKIFRLSVTGYEDYSDALLYTEEDMTDEEFAALAQHLVDREWPNIIGNEETFANGHDLFIRVRNILLNEKGFKEYDISTYDIRESDYRKRIIGSLIHVRTGTKEEVITKV